MKSLIKYEIVNNNLFIIENLYWHIKPLRSDSIREWKLSNVDKADISEMKLEKLISYEVDSYIEVEHLTTRKRLIIRFHSDSQEYSFQCDDIYQNVRPFNVGELMDIMFE